MQALVKIKQVFYQYITNPFRKILEKVKTFVGSNTLVWFDIICVSYRQFVAVYEPSDPVVRRRVVNDKPEDEHNVLRGCGRLFP